MPRRQGARTQRSESLSGSSDVMGESLPERPASLGRSAVRAFNPNGVSPRSPGLTAEQATLGQSPSTAPNPDGVASFRE